MVAAAEPLARVSLTPEVVADIESGRLESAEPEEILSWAVRNFHPRMALSASFGAPEGIAVLHMLHRIEPGTRVFVLDTGRMHQATYDLIDRIRDRFGKQIEVVFPDATAVQRMVSEHGMNLFFESPEKRQLCCRLRKVDPMRRFVVGLDAYVTGLRRDQNANRSDAAKVAVDRSYGGVVKVNPLADWSHDDVWQYVRRYDLPVNRLHSQGYPSVGCAPCSRAIAPGDDPRAGRWWWEQDGLKECGLHVPESDGSGI